MDTLQKCIDKLPLMAACGLSQNLYSSIILAYAATSCNSVHTTTHLSWERYLYYSSTSQRW